MGFSESKESGGVTVVKVDGQLIIGNRQELKDLVQGALDRGVDVHPPVDVPA